MTTLTGGGYPYQALNPTTQEIRLLTLSYPEPPASATTPKNDNDDEALPHCTFTLTHASLTSTPPPTFTALSYVWGDPTITQPLRISIPSPPDPNAPPSPNPHKVPTPNPANPTPEQTPAQPDAKVEVQITHNLHTALTRLRRQRWSGRLWVDALCINQRDTQEKNVQVPLMSRIYRLAEQVLVWLGPEEDYGLGLFAVGELGALWRGEVREKGMERGRIEAFVKTVLGFSVIAGVEGAKPEGGESEGAGGAGGAVSVAQPRVGFDFEAIWRLFRGRPWWRRVWIIQEVVLARQAIVLCGADPEARGALVSWEDVADCIQMFEWMILYPSTAPQHQGLYALVGDIYTTFSHLALASSGYKRSLTEAGNSGDDDGGMALLDTIMLTSLATSPDGFIQATDPRDRIYGLLGLVREEGRRKIPVDYSPDMTVNKLLFFVGKALLQEHGPDILSFCQRVTPTPPSNDKLPCWAPDWTAPRMQVIGGTFFGTQAEDHNRGDASGGARWQDWSPCCRIDGVVFEDPVVTLMGVIVASVSNMASEFSASPSSPAYLDECGDWLREISTMVRAHTASDGDALDQIWRVPIADFGFGARADIEGAGRFIHGFEVLTGKVQPPPELDNDVSKMQWISSQSWDYRRVWKVHERRAFVDAAGRPGLGPKNMAVGDSIAVFAGGRVPFLLRKDSSASHRYRVLGPVYVYGLMDGEAVADGVPFGELQIA